MAGFGLGGSEHHGGVPTQGQGSYATPDRAREITDELTRTRGRRRGRGPKRPWWRFWRRDGRARSD